MNEPQNIAAFKSWLVKNGATIHPDVHFEPVASGFNAIARNDVPADTAVVSIPYSLSVTPEVAKTALQQISSASGNAGAAQLDGLIERQLVCTYVCMHWIVEPSSPKGSELGHGPYIDSLPSPEKLRTPLHFSPVELEAFRGSNLYGATLDRRREWEAEWEQCRAAVSSLNSAWGEQFTWDRYLTASTYLSSRAFPSTVLSDSPSLVTTPSSYPVLLPGIDALNHARAHPVSWVVSSGKSASTTSSPSEPSISLVIHAATPRGGELFNNYGPKPNSELILGYGFSLPNNPDDTIVLKIGGPSAAPSGSQSSSDTSSAGRWEVGRNARGADPVWDAVLFAIGEQSGDDEEDGDGVGRPSIEDQLCAADMLAEMAQNLYDRLPPFPPANAAEMRPEVVEMLDHYLEGQRAILQSLVAFARDKEAYALQLAREQGLDIVEEEDEAEDEE
ncbi:SET domain-containing protein [Pilatotrama ljubarskyi]|nr:SET domain-containing protein [Pilatotrama ljubarskyi]